MVDVGYSERFLASLAPAAPASELAPFLHGLEFTEGRPSYVATIPVGRGPQALAIAYRCSPDQRHTTRHGALRQTSTLRRKQRPTAIAKPRNVKK